jgi:predicted RNase H-like HicB family nuclease
MTATKEQLHALIERVPDSEIATVAAVLATAGYRDAAARVRIQLASIPAAGTLTEYIRVAMARAQYERLEDEEAYWGEIPGFEGVWGKAPTLEACRAELQSTLEDWLLFSLINRYPVPIVDGLELRADQVA